MFQEQSRGKKRSFKDRDGRTQSSSKRKISLKQSRSLAHPDLRRHMDKICDQGKVRKPSIHKESSGVPLKQKKSMKQNYVQQRQRRQSRGPPSEAALILSTQLKDLSREKKWDEALALYRSDSNDGIRDNHHACIMIDIAARCGKISEGEGILKELEDKKVHISVEMKTALLKGFAHSGDIAKADAVFQRMCTAKAKADLPNNRTLNTLLRGCLWSACMVANDAESIVGGVVTAERAWEAYKELKVAGRVADFDVSSYEYLVGLFCQALRIQDAKAAICAMEMEFGVSSKDSMLAQSNDQSVTEALAGMHVALGRAHAILNEPEQSVGACQRSLVFAEISKSALKSSTSFSRKRSWKESIEDGDRRDESNRIYRDHRLSEIETEASTIMKICNESVQASASATRGLARRLATRLVYISGGGTSEGHNQNKSSDAQRDSSKRLQTKLVNSLFFSFGLAAVVSTLDIPGVNYGTKPLTQKQTNRILGTIGLQGGTLNHDGTLNLQRIFSSGIDASKIKRNRKGSGPKRVEVELGAGFGDWIVRKAMENLSTNFIAVELRADRVAQIFARTAILSNNTPINNLCIVGGESGNFLSNCLRPLSIDTVYMNHPEPPTQTFGSETEALVSIMEGGNEPAHMLRSDVLIAAARTLKRSKQSKIVIVTDNKWYARLICATLHKVKSLYPGILESMNLQAVDGQYQKLPVPDLEQGTLLASIFVGQPNETVGYPSRSSGSGESYFDRLWRAGGGIHADKRARYILVQTAMEV